MEPGELRDAVARNIRASARRKRLTLNALADFSGVSRSGLYAVLATTTSPTIDWIAKVASALGVEPAQLLTPRPAPKRESI